MSGYHELLISKRGVKTVSLKLGKKFRRCRDYVLFTIEK